jgi:hypothetical protein
VKATVNLNDDLYRRVKIRAAEDGVTVTSIFEVALAWYLAEGGGTMAEQPRPRFVIPVLDGSGGLVAGVDLNNGRQLQELFDADGSLEQLR